HGPVVRWSRTAPRGGSSRQAGALPETPPDGLLFARRTIRLLRPSPRSRRFVYLRAGPGSAAPRRRFPGPAHRLTMAQDPEKDTRDRQYTERLIRLQRAP